jgi:hypothetical protein
LFPLFSTGVVDTSGKLAEGAIYTGGNLPPDLLTPEANLPPVSSTPAVLVAKSATCVTDIETCAYVHEFSKKIQNYPNTLWRACGKRIRGKTLKQKIS